MDRRIGYLLKRVQSGLRGEMDRILAGKGLTTAQYSTLSALEATPESSNADLARRAFVTPQTMLRIIENLEAAELVTRKAHPTHGRILTTSLTPKGAALVASCHQDVGAVEEQIFRPLKSAERDTLQALLERCAEGLSLE